MKKVTKFGKASFNTLGERIRAERSEKGLSQEQLAKELYLSREQINYIETDRRIPDINKLTSIADLLDVSTDYLLGRINSKKIDNTNISKRIGLNDASIESLSKFTEKDGFQLDALYGELGNYQDFSLIINKIIENEKFETLIYYIRKYINSFKIEKLKQEIDLDTVIYVDELTNKEITKRDIQIDSIEQEIYNKNYNESSTTIYAYKINSIFLQIINDITEDLEPIFSERWILNEEKTKILKICKDGSEKIELLKDRGVEYKMKRGDKNGSTRNNKK